MDRRKDPATGVERQREIYLDGVAGRQPRVPVNPEALAEEAARVMSAKAHAYVAGGAGGEATVAANRRAFERWRIVPRVLAGAAHRDLSVTLFGRRLPAPLLLAPIGVLELVHREADLAVARAAAAERVPMIFSNQASRPMEECAVAMGEAPHWFQLYWSTDDALVESFVRRAEACGCSAIVLTLDTTLLGWRPRDLDLAYLPFLEGKGIAQYTSDPVFRDALAREGEPAKEGQGSRPPLTLSTLATALRQALAYPGSFRERFLAGMGRKAVARFIATYSRPSLTWQDLPRLRRLTRLPILLKGILHPDDARLAMDYGMDGVVVSNHGGRQIDGEIAALDALSGVVEAVGGRIPVLFDSGIRSGADAFKVLALGAAAVCLGRPYVYGLAIAGEEGVREVVRNVVAELDLTMGLAGCRSVAEIGRHHLAPMTPA